MRAGMLRVAGLREGGDMREQHESRDVVRKKE